MKTALAVLLVAMPGSAYAMCQTPLLFSGNPSQNQAAQQAFQSCLANERFQQQQMQMQQQQLEMQRQQQRQMQQLNQPDYTIAMQGRPTVELMNPLEVQAQHDAFAAQQADNAAQAMQRRNASNNMARAQAERDQSLHEQQTNQAELYASYDRAKREIRGAVVDKIRAGDCKGGEDLALLSGDLEMATQVRNYCAAPPVK